MIRAPSQWERRRCHGAGAFDRAGNLMRFAGPDFSTQGVVASVGHRLPYGTQVRLGYANGSALAMPALPHPAAVSQVLGNGAYRIALKLTRSLFPARWTVPGPSGAPVIDGSRKTPLRKWLRMHWKQSRHT